MALTLSHTEGEWDGTFAATLDTLISDLLKDGPFEVRSIEVSLQTYENGTVIAKSDEYFWYKQAGVEGMVVQINAVTSIVID